MSNIRFILWAAAICLQHAAAAAALRASRQRITCCTMAGGRGSPLSPSAGLVAVGSCTAAEPVACCSCCWASLLMKASSF